MFRLKGYLNLHHLPTPVPVDPPGLLAAALFDTSWIMNTGGGLQRPAYFDWPGLPPRSSSGHAVSSSRTIGIDEVLVRQPWDDPNRALLSSDEIQETLLLLQRTRELDACRHKPRMRSIQTKHRTPWQVWVAR